MRFKKFLTVLVRYIGGNYALYVSLIGEAQTGTKQINYLENK